MTQNIQQNQRLGRRLPRQARALQKVELILEATVRILDQEGVDALTTNRIASVAGVSIGTLYQYFADRQEILDALVHRELEAIHERVMCSLRGPAPAEHGGRIRAVVRAVLDAFGGRSAVQHQLLMAADRGASANSPGTLRAAIVDLLVTTGIEPPDRGMRKLTRAEAFVMVHAFVGVLRGVLATTTTIPRAAIEDALVRLVLAYVTD